MNMALVAFAISFLPKLKKRYMILSWLFIASQAVVVAPIILNLIVDIHKQNYVTSQFVNYSILFHVDGYSF